MEKTIDAGPLLEKLDAMLNELQAKSEEHKDYAMCRGFMLAMKEVENAVANEEPPQRSCEFCKYGYDEDSFYISADWDAGTGFEHHHMHYCPICGRKLSKE